MSNDNFLNFSSGFFFFENSWFYQEFCELACIYYGNPYISSQVTSARIPSRSTPHPTVGSPQKVSAGIRRLLCRVGEWWDHVDRKTFASNRILSCHRHPPPDSVVVIRGPEPQGGRIWCSVLWQTRFVAPRSGPRSRPASSWRGCVEYLARSRSVLYWPAAPPCPAGLVLV